MPKNDATSLPADDLAALSLTELRARLEQLTGVTSKTPNKTFYVKRIRAALEAQGAPETPATPEAAPAPPAEADAATTATEAPAKAKVKLSKLTIDDLRARYVDVVGRPTKSVDRAYLCWKIREVERGRIKAGPARQSGRPAGGGGEHKVLPLRLEADAAAKLDEATTRLGYPTRMAFLRDAIGSLLTARGEAEVAALFGK